MTSHKTLFLGIIMVVMSVFTLNAQTKKTVTEDYIMQFRDIALQNEKDYGIPSSITLAQGIIESGSGRSSLAREGNNHFGIKCHQSWTGKKMYKDDDKKNDCFRVYENAEDSYTDHSMFLKNNKRYSSLFALDKTDYVSWAKGLKEAGYATNPQYANLLIDIIELYDLDKLSSNEFYLVADNTKVTETVKPSSNDTPTKPNTQPTTSREEKPQVKEKKSLGERLFGNTTWWKRRHETEQERKRREMDEKIQKMIDEQDVRRTDFEVTFE